MKNLYSYILEARETIGVLPFSLEEFKTFMTDSIIDMGYDDAEIWDILKDKFIEKYPEKLWKVFTAICEMYLELHDVSIEEFYKGFENIPIKRVENVKGAGSNGVALQISDDKIVKIFYGESIKKCDEPFIKYCYKRDSTVFPKVYKIGKKWCIMELLDVYTDKCKLYMDTLDESKIDGKSLFNYMMDNKYKFDEIDTSKFTDTQKEVFEWCKMVDMEMKNINSSYISFPGDLVLKNIGERKNGEIIFFDI